MPGSGGESISTLWARSKIESLEDSRLFGVDANLVREKVVDMALAYGLLTRYTSLVAVDRTPARPEQENIETRDVPNLLPAGSSFASGFSQTATGWPLQLIFSLISLIIVFGMLLYSAPSRARPAEDDRSPVSDPRR